MTRAIKAGLTGLTLAIWPCLVAAADPETLTWLISDQAPQFIVDGIDKKNGSMDQTLGIIQKALPSFKHEMLVANSQRSLLLLKPEGRYLGMGFVKTPEREKILLFSTPITFGLPPTLLVRTDQLAVFKPFIGPGDRINLEALLHSGNVALGISQGRSYGPVLDPVIDKYKSNPGIINQVAGQKIGENLVQMVFNRRLSCTLSYGTEFRYLMRDETLAKQLTSLPIFGVSNAVSIHIVAPKDAWGQAMIARVDQVLIALRKTEAYLTAVSIWDDPETRAAKRAMILAL